MDILTSLAANLYDPLLARPLRSIRNSISGQLVGSEKSAVIDLCCGTGDQLRKLSEKGFTSLTGVDLSPEMCAVAGRSGKNLNIHNADASDTGLPDGSFDWVIISLALHEKRRFVQKNILEEAYRLLDENGKLLIADYCYDEDTLASGRTMTTLAEWIAGGNHYLNFKNYIAGGGLDSLINDEQFRLIESERRLRGAVTVSVFGKAGTAPTGPSS